MKKLIKFLFPKTYQSIYNEGYSYHEYLTYGQYEDYQDDYYNHDDYDAQYEQDELQRLHDEYYAQIAEDEYQLELTRLHEEDCKEEQQKLIKLYSPKVPLLKVGDRIHLHSKEGMYTVSEVHEYSFAYCTKYSDNSYTDYSDYKCHAGGRWNQ
jgi:hypothetical protein